MINLKKIPSEGIALGMGMPIAILVLLTGAITYFGKGVGAAAFLGFLAFLVLVSVLKLTFFMKKTEELDEDTIPEVRSMVSSVCEYLGIDEPQILSFESDFEEVFAIGLGKTKYLVMSEVALQKLESDELEFLIIQEMLNIFSKRVLPLTIFAPDGKTSGIGHLFTKWINAVERNNDKAVLVLTKNIEQSIRTIIKVNYFDEEFEMSLKDMVNIFMTTRKSQLKNITEAIDLDDYIIDRVVEVLRFSRSSEYKKASDSTPLMNIKYSYVAGGEREAIKINDRHEERKVSADLREETPQRVHEKREIEEEVKAKPDFVKDDSKYYSEIMDDANYEYQQSEIEIDLEKQAADQFKNISSRMGRNDALREVAATEDEDMQKTSVMKDKYNIVRDNYDDFEEEEFDNKEGAKKMIIIALAAVLALVAIGFGAKFLLGKKTDDVDAGDGNKKPTTGDNVDGETKSTDEVLTEVVQSFNYDWAKYVSDGEESYKQYVKEGSTFEEKLNTVNTRNKTIKYLEIDVKNYKLISDDEHQVMVYEKIEETINGETSVREYDKTYTLNKVDKKWLIADVQEKEIVEEPKDNDEERYANSSFDPGFTYQYSAVPNSVRLTGAEADSAEAFVKNFNDAWIDFINNGNRDVFNYYIKDQGAYNAAVKFSSLDKNKGLKEKFLLMDIEDARKTSAAYYIWVHEKIEEDRNGSVKVIDAHWIYMLRKNGDGFLLQEFFKDPAYR